MRIDTELLQSNMLQLNESKLTEKTINNGFESFFNAALDLYNRTNEYQNEAEQMQVDYVIGKTDDIIGLNMAQSRASSSLQFTTQVTNKILSAYQEIMRIQM